MEEAGLSRKLIFPEDFSDYAWEVESKGYFDGASVKVGDRCINVTFYDPTRLSQDIREDFRAFGMMELRRVLVVESVTEEEMMLAVDRATDEFFV